MGKKFRVRRVGDAAKMNFDSCFAELRAEVNYLNGSAAFDWQASRYPNGEFRNWYPGVSMLNAIRLD